MLAAVVYVKYSLVCKALSKQIQYINYNPITLFEGAFLWVQFLAFLLWYFLKWGQLNNCWVFPSYGNKQKVYKT